MRHSWTFIYMRNGRYTHIGELMYSAHPEWLMTDGYWDDPDNWLGTGSQEEYEIAKIMQVCPLCMKTRLALRETEKK